MTNESKINDIIEKIQTAKDDMSRIWKFLDKIMGVIKYKDHVGTVTSMNGEFKGIAHYAGAPKKGEELESIMSYANIAKQGVEEVEKALDEAMNDILIVIGGECESR